MSLAKGDEASSVGKESVGIQLRAPLHPMQVRWQGAIQSDLWPPQVVQSRTRDIGIRGRHAASGLGHIAGTAKKVNFYSGGGCCLHETLCIQASPLGVMP